MRLGEKNRQQARRIDVRTEPTPDAPSSEVWGRPGSCPRCAGPGELDRIDVVDRIQYEHCTVCRHEWSVAEAETARVSS